MSDKKTKRQGAFIRAETSQDSAAIDSLIAACFGETRHQRSVRHFRLCQPVSSLCFVIEDDGRLIGSIRYWPIMIAHKVQLLLGPLAVHPDYKGQGYGKALVEHSLAMTGEMSYDFILISGEPDYYPRFGFEPVKQDCFMWPGYIETERLQIKWLSDNNDNCEQGAALAILPIS